VNLVPYEWLVWLKTIALHGLFIFSNGMRS